ncbi:autophagy protein 5 [Lignoscripta atroalba]|nr:autophagy protein 5 [Lignoscripta atroalba]
MTTPKDLKNLQESVWNGSLPLEIRLSPSDCRVYDQADPYLIHYHRLSYLPLLLPRLHTFFHPFLIDPVIPSQDGWFSFEGVPLKWHYPIGLLYDLFSGSSPSQAPNQRPFSEDTPDPLPWKLVLHFTEWPDEQLVRLDAEGKVLHDAFINSVKEADFLRNGTGKGIMTLSKDDSTQLWKAVQDHDFATYNPIAQKLLHAQGAPLRHLPLRIYLPSSPSVTEPASGHLKVVQSLITPSLPNSREQQTLGMVLHSLLPSLFPSRRTPILAKPMLHGAVVPMGASVEELVRGVSYLDGWIHLGVMMIG